MSRPIRFRAWHNGTKAWLHDSACASGGCNILGETIWAFGEWCRVPLEELNDVVVEQFTGLVDKAGREIYEGDILEITSQEPRHGANYSLGEHWMDDGSSPFETIKRMCRVEWSESGAMWRSVYLNWFLQYAGADDGKPVTGILSSTMSGNECAIIGNIHQ